MELQRQLFPFLEFRAGGIFRIYRHDDHRRWDRTRRATKEPPGCIAELNLNNPLYTAGAAYRRREREFDSKRLLERRRSPAKSSTASSGGDLSVFPPSIWTSSSDSHMGSTTTRWTRLVNRLFLVSRYTWQRFVLRLHLYDETTPRRGFRRHRNIDPDTQRRLRNTPVQFLQRSTPG